MENEQEETYDEPDWIDRHSVNCFICGKLVDERDCIPGSVKAVFVLIVKSTI